jgi:hypothetical protein
MSTARVISTRAWRVIYVSTLLIVSIASSSCDSSASAAPQTTPTESAPITVKIIDPDIKTAIARVVGTDQIDSLDQKILTFSSCVQGQQISLWAPGHYIKTIPCNGSSPYQYSTPLDAIDPIDNPNYSWIGAVTGSNPALNCEICHSDQSPGLNEYSEWKMDGHSKAMMGPYFWTTYMGMDAQKNPGQQTRWSISGDGQKIRLARDPSLPYYGPGFKLDYPNENGNCIYCHVPAGGWGTEQEIDLPSLVNSSFGNYTNVATQGVTCDVCHKVTDVLLGQNQLPYVERPGILSFSFMRPASDSQFAVGPRPDVATSSADIKRTCSPVFSESKFCAACHYGKFSDVEIYGSYKEWLDSPYSKSDQNYRSCQDCHMPSSEQIGNTLPSQRSACSETNLKFHDFNHNMMKYGTDGDNTYRVIPLLVKEAATVNIDEVKIAGGQIKIKVTVVNSGAGHKFPTDSPLRHLILFIEAKDINNNPLTQVSGPMIPKVGDSDYAGLPGQIYANILKDKDTNSSPTIAYWNPVGPAWEGSDTRLVPKVPVQSEYSFVAPSNGSARITIKLIYRDMFLNLADQRGLIPMDIEVTKSPQIEVP